MICSGFRYKFQGIAAFAALTVLLGAGAAAAEQKAKVSPLPVTGTELAESLAICRAAGVTAADAANWRACSGYLAGIIVGATALASERGIEPLFCLPEGTGDIALQDAIIAHIKSDPRVAAQPAHIAVLDAMAGAYPCK